MVVMSAQCGKVKKLVEAKKYKALMRNLTQPVFT